MHIARELASSILEAAQQLPIITITGPRQSGKTTLIKQLFPSYEYINLEIPNVRENAQQDPYGLLRNHKQGIIIDEAQYVPTLFSYIQAISDEHPQNGKFILTGSQNFLLLAGISQSLAGRTAIFTLLPFSLEELIHSPYEFYNDANQYIFHGFYPRIYTSTISPTKWYASYIQTYLEKDVRSTLQIKDLLVFQRFLKLCAGRIGQLVNYANLSNEAGVSDKTIKSWLSILEARYIIFSLPPYYRNFKKRLVKSHKLYFYDTGLACHLLGIRKSDDLTYHHSYGALFENFVLAEIMKVSCNQGERIPIYFWREQSGNEIDCLIESGSKLIPIEIKATQTPKVSMAVSLEKIMKNLGNMLEEGYIVHGGRQQLNYAKIKLLSWKNIAGMIKPYL